MASVSKRPDGRYRARFRGPDGRERAKHFRTRAEAQRWLDEVTASLVTGTYTDPRAGRVPFADYAEQVAGRRVWTESTVTAARQAWRGFPLRDTALADIHRRELEQWVRQMAVGSPGSAALAPSTIRTRCTYVRLVLASAVRDRLIAQDPFEGITLPRLRRAEAAMAIPTPEEVADALRVAPLPFRAFVGLASLAGLRQGEAAALAGEDIDWPGGAVRVRRQVVGEGAAVALAAPKHGSERVVPAPPQLMTLLAAHVNDVGLRSMDGRAQLFTDRRGRLLSRAATGALWRQVRRDGEIAAHLTLHDLRHFYASGLIAAGCDVVTVQRALGHAQASVTLNTYAHLWPSSDDRVRNAASGLAEAVLRT